MIYLVLFTCCLFRLNISRLNMESHFTFDFRLIALNTSLKPPLGFHFNFHHLKVENSFWRHKSPKITNYYDSVGYLIHVKEFYEHFYFLDFRMIKV